MLNKREQKGQNECLGLDWGDEHAEKQIRHICSLSQKSARKVQT